uniref:DUF1758 domain-containing protein n=1 Tax=Meloidogyne enterolobii TaxID=390850 RepID=A0A6V7XAZ3_MELEN|nr:unnamed protein product [Meloidogyne enterolobii]
MTIEAPIYNPQRPHIKQKALIFIDPGSQRSFISAKMADSLDLPVIVANETCRLTSFGERRAKEYKSDLVRANLQTKGGGKLSIVLNKLKFLVNPLPLYDLKELTGEELNQVRLTTNVEHRQPDLLIGMDLFHELKVEKKTTLPSGFTISESRLGKLLSGAGQIENAIGAHTVFAASIQVNAAFECDDNSDDETSESKRKNWPNENSPGNNSAKGKKKRPKNKSSKKKESRDKMVNHNLPSNNWPEERSTKKKSKKTNTPLDKDSEEEKINKTSEKIEVPPSNQNADESKQRDSTRIENPQSNKDVKEDIQKKSKRTDTPLAKINKPKRKKTEKLQQRLNGNSTKVEPPQGNHNAEEERQINSTRVDTPLGNQCANEEEITKKSKRTDTPLVKKAEEKEKPSGKSHKKAQEEDKIKNPVKDTNPLGNQQAEKQDRQVNSTKVETPPSKSHKNAGGDKIEDSTKDNTLVDNSMDEISPNNNPTKDTTPLGRQDVEEENKRKNSMEDELPPGKIHKHAEDENKNSTIIEEPPGMSHQKAEGNNNKIENHQRTKCQATIGLAIIYNVPTQQKTRGPKTKDKKTAQKATICQNTSQQKTNCQRAIHQRTKGQSINYQRTSRWKTNQQSKDCQTTKRQNKSPKHNSNLASQQEGKNGTSPPASYYYKAKEEKTGNYRKGNKWPQGKYYYIVIMALLSIILFTVVTAINNPFMIEIQKRADQNAMPEFRGPHTTITKQGRRINVALSPEKKAHFTELHKRLGAAKTTIITTTTRPDLMSKGVEGNGDYSQIPTKLKKPEAHQIPPQSNQIPPWKRQPPEVPSPQSAYNKSKQIENKAPTPRFQISKTITPIQSQVTQTSINMRLPVTN